MKTQAVLILALIVLLPAVANAQTGCLDSPENPTALLALVGSAAAWWASTRRNTRKGK